jgi:hypothetical protein
MFKSFGKLLVYPYTRVIRDVGGSIGRTAKAYKEAQALRARRAEESSQQEGQQQELTPQQKFAELAEEREWTEAELKTQHLAARRSRWASLIVGVLFFAGFLTGMWHLPFLVVAILAPLLLILVAASLVNASRMAWYEYQLETRSLVSLQVFLSRTDLFRRVFAW